MTTDQQLLDAVAELRTRDHQIVSEDYAHKVATCFGFVPETEIFAPDLPTRFKGIYLYDHAKRDAFGYARGVSAADLARQICHHLDVDYDLCGEGGTLQSCCDNLIAHLRQQQHRRQSNGRTEARNDGREQTGDDRDV